MALKHCITEAGKALDEDDRSYMIDLDLQGRSEEEIVDRLEQNILKERDELILLLEGQGLTIATAEVSTESLGAPVTGEDASASAQVDGATKARETSTEAEESGAALGTANAVQDEGKAKPSPQDASSAETLKGGVGAPDSKLGISSGEDITIEEFKKQTGITNDQMAVLSSVLTVINKKLNASKHFSPEIELLLDKVFLTKDPLKSIVQLVAITASTGAARDQVNALLKEQGISVKAYQEIKHTIIKNQGLTLAKITDLTIEINKIEIPKPSADSFFAELTPVEKALKIKEDAAAVNFFIEKVAPVSPLFAHFIKTAKIVNGIVFDPAEVEETGLQIGVEAFPFVGGDSYNPDLDIVSITGRGVPVIDKEAMTMESKKLDLNNKEDLQAQVEVLEHELIHAYTVPHITKVFAGKGSDQDTLSVEYIRGATLKLQDLYTNGKLKGLSDATIARIEYILQQPSHELAVIEFISIVGAESKASAEIYKALTGAIPEKTLRQHIERLLTSIKDAFMAMTVEQFNAEIDAEVLQQAILNTFIEGKSMREQKRDEFANWRIKAVEHITGARDEQFKKQQAELEASIDGKIDENTSKEEAEGILMEAARKSGLLGIGPRAFPDKTPHYDRKASFDYMNYAVSSMLNSKLERKGKKLLGNLHDIMYKIFPLYTDAADKAVGIYNGSPALQQFLHTVTGEGVNKVRKADVLAKFAAVNAQRTEIINDQVNKLTVLSKNLSDNEKADLATFIADTPLHDYFVLAVGLTTAEEIDAKAELLRKKLWKLNPHAVLDVDKLVDWNVDGDTGTTIYNLSTKYPPGKKYPTSEFQRDLRQLLALESIKRVGSKRFEKLLKNEELMSVIKDNSVANVFSTMKNEGTENVRDSLVMEYYKEPFEIKAIREKDFGMYEFGENTGWKVLKAPTRTELGIVYKPTIDSTDIAGAYTDMKLTSTDITVSQDLKSFPGVVESRSGHKLLLTKKQKKDLGLIEGFEQSLVRSTAHSMAMTESQIIRDLVLQNDTWMEIGENRSKKKLEGIIESDNMDNPWFIKLEEGTKYNDLSDTIRAKYMPVGKRVSNVADFNEKVDLVRKDISHWLLGGSAKSLFENPQMKWAIRILKNLVSGAKIGMIVLNPIKIANDNLSNLAYLGVLGLNPKFIATNYEEIQRDFAEYTELQRQIFQIKLQIVARPDSESLKTKLKGLQKRVAKNSVGDIGEKGFVNSLGSDLVSRSADTLSGFQADMHKSLEYLLTDKSGNKNVVSHFIVQLQKIGYQAEDFFGYLGDLAGKAKSTKLLQQELDQVADRLREIKSEEDIINYVAQFTTSPSSEAVRFGSAMTDLTDVLAKETLYRHLTQNQKMSDSDARIQVLDSFPDYKENMPLSIKALSDLGIIMFPSFWLRIQKIIYRMARDKPVGLATELMVQEMIGSDINTIFEANVINKSNTFGGLLHTPFEPVGLGSVVPMHIFG